jgi:general secretion pathway protein D
VVVRRAVRLSAAIACSLVLGGGAVGPVAAQAPTPTPAADADAPRPLAPDALVMMDFQDVEIATLVKFISEITGRNFLIDETIKGKVSVISPSKITVDEAYRVFQSVLQVKGFTLIDTGPVVKIIATKDVKGSGLPRQSETATPSDAFVTRILPLVHLEAGTAASLLQPLLSREGLISAYIPTNSIIVVDSASNIARLVDLIGDLDVPGQERTVEILTLRHAYAEDLAKVLQDSFGAGQAGAKKPAAPARAPTTGIPSVTKPATAASSTVGAPESSLKVVPETRSNSLILIGSPYEIRQARALVVDLDQPLPRGTGRINVYQLKHADATELVQVLADLIGASVSIPRRESLPGRTVTEGGGRFGSRSLRGPSSTFGQTDFARSVISGPGAGSLGGLGGRPAPSAAGRISGGGVTTAGTGESAVQFEGDVRITADPATNSLLISASPPDYGTLVEVIVQLDVPRRQVLVEAIIFEVTIDKARDLGIELQGGTSMLNGKAVGLARTSFRNLNAVGRAVTGDTAALSNISGLLSALISQQNIILADGTEIPAGIALLSALEADSDINVLSAPTILTSDNEEAEIVVAQNVPFVSSRATDQTNLANTFSSIDRRDVGITLRITPQITEGGMVRLFVFEEVSALVETSETQVLQLGPTTTVRSATTTVVVGNNETVAIGGLISDRMMGTDQGVPYLSDIPVVGNLFSFETQRKMKVNLIILLTPRVVTGAEDLERMSYEQRRLFGEARRGKGYFPGTRGLRPKPKPATAGGVLLPAIQPIDAER